MQQCFVDDNAITFHGWHFRIQHMEIGNSELAEMQKNTKIVQQAHFLSSF